MKTRSFLLFFATFAVSPFGGTKGGFAPLRLKNRKERKTSFFTLFKQENNLSS